MSTELFYFSGTGNSLFVAKKLAELMPDASLQPIAALLNQMKDDKYQLKKKKILKATTIGFIFPCHGLTIPVPVKDFLKKLDFNSTEYIFGIVTRGGSLFRGFTLMNQILKRQKRKLDASFVLNMYMNDPKLKWYQDPSISELSRIKNQVISQISTIFEIIQQKKSHHDDIHGDTFSSIKFVNSILEPLVTFAVHNIAAKVKKYFYYDDKCIGCGICQQVCPSQKISLNSEKKPVWDQKIKCYLCYGCLNFCPQKAIQIYDKVYMKSYTPVKGRYPHPYAQVKDMINQKVVIHK